MPTVKVFYDKDGKAKLFELSEDGKSWIPKESPKPSLGEMPDEVQLGEMSPVKAWAYKGAANLAQKLPDRLGDALTGGVRHYPSLISQAIPSEGVQTPSVGPMQLPMGAINPAWGESIGKLGQQLLGGILKTGYDFSLGLPDFIKDSPEEVPLTVIDYLTPNILGKGLGKINVKGALAEKAKEFAARKILQEAPPPAIVKQNLETFQRGGMQNPTVGMLTADPSKKYRSEAIAHESASHLSRPKLEELDNALQSSAVTARDNFGTLFAPDATPTTVARKIRDDAVSGFLARYSDLYDKWSQAADNPKVAKGYETMMNQLIRSTYETPEARMIFRTRVAADLKSPELLGQEFGKLSDLDYTAVYNTLVKNPEMYSRLKQLPFIKQEQLPQALMHHYWQSVTDGDLVNPDKMQKWLNENRNRLKEVMKQTGDTSLITRFNDQIHMARVRSKYNEEMALKRDVKNEGIWLAAGGVLAGSLLSKNLMAGAMAYRFSQVGGIGLDNAVTGALLADKKGGWLINRLMTGKANSPSTLALGRQLLKRAAQLNLPIRLMDKGGNIIGETGQDFDMERYKQGMQEPVGNLPGLTPVQ